MKPLLCFSDLWELHRFVLRRHEISYLKFGFHAPFILELTFENALTTYLDLVSIAPKISKLKRCGDEIFLNFVQNWNNAMA